MYYNDVIKNIIGKDKISWQSKERFYCKKCKQYRYCTIFQDNEETYPIMKCNICGFEWINYKS
jgi:RNase P subunit RPR2